jgi:hypothetical protein
MENREQIKNRMMKTAARLWGYSEDETESSFDPLVNVLFSACALELEKISGEIHASRARLLERMVQLLSPEVLSGPLPAHAVMHAKSIDDEAWLNECDQFYCSQKTTALYESANAGYKDIFFAPSASFQLNTAAVSYLATGQQLIRYREMTSKEAIAHCLPGAALGESVLWVGITGQHISLNNTQCYFDIKNEVNKELFYQNLPQARWFYSDHELTIMPGYNQQNISGEHLDIEQLLTRRNTASWKIKEYVNAFYKPRFITIRDKNNKAIESAGMPAELIKAFNSKDLQQLQQEKIYWIKIQFPENISGAILQDVICHFNCFPVLNSRLHEMLHHMHHILNIIPLTSNDVFFDLHEITDLDGNKYNLRALQKNAQEKLTVILRQGGVGRFDERDAAVIIENIIQLLSDESAAFSVLGRDFLAGEMKQLQQIIYKLEQQMHSRELQRESTPFLVVRQPDDAEPINLMITYWSTCGAQGNDIKAGTALQAYKTAALFHSGCVLISPSVGGRNRLSASESITAYKAALLSRDRLISMEDIKLFCRLEMGNKAKSVDVVKGVMVPPGTSQGFLRTIDVTIWLNRKDYIDAEEKNQLAYWKESLALKLSKKSAGLTPFRVFLLNEYEN